ncbi:D-amino acid oxidase activator [Homo sapiens]|uniref:D-amino acid oxidase activator n=1 Tax=Homo sapiens TaxID=9606 RepID=M0R2M6_HUMAN|nr:D-amino acid oxidase activator [Homo sapiens]KAI4063772.1 D-amino acid oxidase activator [Homo sapiens]
MLEKLMGADSLQLFRSRYTLGKIYFIGFQRSILLSKSENSLNSIGDRRRKRDGNKERRMEEKA